MFHRLAAQWRHPDGYAAVLRIALPMVASMGSQTVMLFTDRYFLARYSMDALAASWPSGMANFALMALFLGTVSYVNVFIAQYMGSSAPRRVGAALWQGIWFCLAAGTAMAATAWLAEPLFTLVGHAPGVRDMEAAYFRVLSLGAVCGLLQATLASFYSGQGITRPVMYVNCAGAALNIPLDYCLIFGIGPFPEMGVAGAAWATVAGAAFSAVLFCLIIFRGENERRFGVRSMWRPDWGLTRRLLRYGAPGGVQFFLEMFAFMIFLFLAGRLSTEALAATNMAISINSLGFLPMLGLHIALSTLAGQAIGARQPDRAARATTSSLHLAWLWTGGMLVVYLALPMPLLRLFVEGDTSPEVLALGATLLRFVAVYAFFDACMVVFFAVLKGAGDTVYVMKSIGCAALLGLVLPGWLAVEQFQAGILALWCILTAYVMLLAGLGWQRYRGGRWRGMHVVETVAPGQSDSPG